MNKNIDILNNPILNIPINRQKTDFYLKLKTIYSEYIELIEDFEGTLGDSVNKNLKNIKREITLILRAVELYYIGKTCKSYLELYKCLDLLKLNNLLEIGKIVGDFYRIRVAQNINLTRKDLFHIPFQLREKVATQRYSIPGLPCLYMADSIFTAWEEMGRPEFNNIHVSRCNSASKSFKLLYLNVTTQEMRQRCIGQNKINHENQLAKFLSYWPLLASCSFNVNERNEAFKPEYIIPQMVLQWIIENDDIHGIQFKSNRISSSVLNVGSFNNIAIPVESSNSLGYCELLKKKIKLTSPLSWALLDISEPTHLPKIKKVSDLSTENIRRASYIELIDGEKTDYFNSKFGIMEEKLKNMSLDFIS